MRNPKGIGRPTREDLFGFYQEATDVFVPKRTSPTKPRKTNGQLHEHSRAEKICLALPNGPNDHERSETSPPYSIWPPNGGRPSKTRAIFDMSNRRRFLASHFPAPHTPSRRTTG